jgi:hypothetical protein
MAVHGDWRTGVFILVNLFCLLMVRPYVEASRDDFNSLLCGIQMVLPFVAPVAALVIPLLGTMLYASQGWRKATDVFIVLLSMPVSCGLCDP